MPLTSWAATTGRGGLYFGTKSLKSNDWGNLDSQPAWGIDFDVKNKKWPVWVTTSFINSHDSFPVVTSISPFTTTDIEGETTELQLGIKKDFAPLPRLRISLAGGPTYVRASLQNSVSPYNKETDSAGGIWGGVDMIVSFNFITLGATYKISQANVNLLGQTVDAGGKNLAFLIGFGW